MCFFQYIDICTVHTKAMASKMLASLDDSRQQHQPPLLVVVHFPTLAGERKVHVAQQ